jgi:type I restriction enzyme S subunit
MRQNYKRLGDYIRLVDERNRNLEVTDLVGLSMTKQFRKSTSNVIGTDMSKYKIVRKNRFACDFMSVIRVFKLPVVLHTDDNPVIVSPAYPTFEVSDENLLLPEYLMMWFRRDEFDRYCFFKCDSAVRGGFNWEELCDTMINLPGIEKQKELVAEYQTIENRIRLNNELCQKLEETAQTVYRHWFEDFEFPVIARSEAQQNDEAISKNQILQVAEHTAEYRNRSELVAERSPLVADRGRSYKSSGGEMVYSEELGKEIPKGWKVETIKEISKEIITGKTPPTDDSENYGSFMPFLTIPDMHNKIFVYEYSKWISKKGVSTQKNKTLPKNAICVSCIGTPGLVVIADEKLHTNQQINNIILKDELSLYYFFFALRGLSKTIIDFGMGAAVLNNLNKDEFSKLPVLVPAKEISQQFNMEMIPIFDKIKISLKQNIKLEELKNLLLGKMAVEGE